MLQPNGTFQINLVQLSRRLYTDGIIEGLKYELDQLILLIGYIPRLFATFLHSLTYIHVIRHPRCVHTI